LIFSNMRILQLSNDSIISDDQILNTV